MPVHMIVIMRDVGLVCKVGFELNLKVNMKITWLIPHAFLNSRSVLERKLADADVSEEDQNNLLKFLEKKETEYMRLQRHKMGADDFELLTMIGKGAFGEVCDFQVV